MLIGDLSVERVRACKARLEAVGAPAQAFEGAAVETIPKMVASVPRGALCLVYIDPYNLQYLSFSMIEALAKLSKVDLVVNFCTMDLRRNVDAELDPDRARFDEVAPGWRQKFGASSGKTTLGLALFNYWMELISGLGFSFSQAMPMVQNDSNREIYRLAFFARHDLPNRIWNDVARDPTRDLFG
jgi:three-Cys-motif partner protein